MCTETEPLISHFRVRFAMRYWRKARPKEHRWVPDSGWTTFRVCREADIHHAIGLMRISYLRYALKAAPDPQQFLKQESKTLP